jgi:hypothetical protein
MENITNEKDIAPQKNRLFLIGGAVLILIGLALLFAGVSAIIFCPFAAVGGYLLYEYKKSK